MQASTTLSPPGYEPLCTSPLGNTIYMDRFFYNFGTRTIDRVVITGNSIRDDHTVCVGEACQTVLTGLRDSANRAAAMLGGWKEEILHALFPKLPLCTTVAPGNPITIDQDAAWNYAAAVDAVKSVYGGSLSTIRALNRVDVKYNSGGSFTFWITSVDVATGTVNLADPSPAQAGGPCQ